MSVHVLISLLNEMGERDKMPGFVQHFIAFFATSLINSNAGSRMLGTVNHMVFFAI